MNDTDQAPCPCGSGRSFADCCGPWLAGGEPPTAEALMRSRYTAFTRGDDAYLLRSWHSSTRPAAVEPAAGPQWLGLSIVEVQAGGPDDREGYVTFVARYLDADRRGELRERSRFLREAGAWRYVDGEVAGGAAKVGRNEPCPCGSGRKYKRCCGG